MARTLNRHRNTQCSPKPSDGGEEAQKTAPGRIAEWVDCYGGDCTRDAEKEPDPHKHVLLGESRAVGQLNYHDEVGHDGEDAAGNVEPEVCV